GAHTVGLWGISRAGWICPLIINQYQNIAFWISVSGVDGKESFGYLFEQNLRINGHPEKEISHLVEEWKKGNEITHQGGRYDEYLAATEQLRKNSFIQRFNGGRQVTEEGFYNYQEFFKQQLWDTTAQLQIYIEDFESLLAKVNCPVLALFGEQDMTVDWQKTKALYERILSPQRLVIESFPRCNHNLFQCKTGGFYEFEDNNLAWNRCDGFLDTMTNWLQKLGN
ncbi:MAG: alpha/beta hydrolase, partial [Bacteroidota bacterium]